MINLSDYFYNRGFRKLFVKITDLGEKVEEKENLNSIFIFEIISTKIKNQNLKKYNWKLANLIKFVKLNNIFKFNIFQN